LATSQAVRMRLRSGTLASRAAATSARLLPETRARVSTAIGVSISPGMIDVGADAVLGVLDRDLLGEGNHRHPRRAADAARIHGRLLPAATKAQRYRRRVGIAATSATTISGRR